MPRTPGRDYPYVLEELPTLQQSQVRPPTPSHGPSPQPLPARPPTPPSSPLQQDQPRATPPRRRYRPSACKFTPVLTDNIKKCLLKRLDKHPQKEALVSLIIPYLEHHFYYLAALGKDYKDPIHLIYLNHLISNELYDLIYDFQTIQ